MKLNVYKPSPLLSPFVISYAFFEGELNNNKIKPVPNGSVELIIHYGDQPKISDSENQSAFTYNSVITGQFTDKQYCLELNGGYFKCLTISFSLTGFYALIGIPQIETRNQLISLDSIFGFEANLLREQIATASDDIQRVKIVDAFLLKHCMKKEVKIHKTIHHAIYLMKSGKGIMPVDKLVTELNLSVSAFERNFKYVIGLTPKEFSGIIRFNNVYRELQLMPPGTKWHDIVHKYGYYDQSHFIKDIKKYTDLPPSEFIGKMNEYVYGKRLYLGK